MKLAKPVPWFAWLGMQATTSTEPDGTKGVSSNPDIVWDTISSKNNSRSHSLKLAHSCLENPEIQQKPSFFPPRKRHISDFELQVLEIFRKSANVSTLVIRFTTSRNCGYELAKSTYWCSKNRGRAHVGRRPTFARQRNRWHRPLFNFPDQSVNFCDRSPIWFHFRF